MSAGNESLKNKINKAFGRKHTTKNINDKLKFKMATNRAVKSTGAKWP